MSDIRVSPSAQWPEPNGDPVGIGPVRRLGFRVADDGHLVPTDAPTDILPRAQADGSLAPSDDRAERAARMWLVRGAQSEIYTL